MLQEDIICPSASPSSAPVVLVEMKVEEGEEKKYRNRINSGTHLEPRTHSTEPAGRPSSYNSRDYYLDLDGVVYRKSQDSRHGDLLVAPSALLPEIMKTYHYHDLPISGHTGYDRTYAMMKKMFIRLGMSKDIKKGMDYPFDGIFKHLQVRYVADSNYIAEFMQRMKIAHRNAIQTIEAMTD
ncbi:hypothetical protein JTB14_008280 [Gonioctena quinquepunctata]|nr:hypothetical protein JTB14_008280 [Gonioctena quinquepunctata]